MIRIEIDLNVRAKGGRTRVSLRHAALPVARGDQVLVFEPDEDVETTATVHSLSSDGRFAFLDVDWDQLHEATGLLGEVVASNYSHAVASVVEPPFAWVPKVFEPYGLPLTVGT